MASVRYVGRGDGWVKLSATVLPLNTAGLATNTSVRASTDAPSPASWIRRATAVTPAPRSIAVPSKSRGDALSVDRMARPAVVSVMIHLRNAPIGDGSVNGLAPTESTIPTTTSRMKNDL